MEGYVKQVFLVLMILIIMSVTSLDMRAQSSEGFIYGRVYTSSNQYQGQIRWGKGEAFWNDHFNVSKLSKDNYKIPKSNEDEVTKKGETHLCDTLERKLQCHPS